MKITVAHLIKELELSNPEDEISFGSGDFSFYRVKDRGGEVQIEFNEVEGRDYSLLPAHRNYVSNYDTNYVVFDSTGVWGYGDTQQDALNDAEEYYTSDGNNFKLDFKLNKLRVEKATPRLIVYVENNGGANVLVAINNEGIADIINAKESTDSIKH